MSAMRQSQPCPDRVLVTGARGFIGRHTLAPLLAHGYEVHAVTSSAQLADTVAGVHWHRANLLSGASTQALTESVRPSHLLHLAWFIDPPMHFNSDVNIQWVHASLWLLHAFAAAGGRRAVLAGTYAEYEPSAVVHCVEHDTPLRPASLYAAAKHGLHVVAEAWAQQHDVGFAWARIFNAYGPYGQPNSLVGMVARALLRGQEVATSRGDQVRDYLYVGELGRALVCMLTSDIAGAVNVASGVPVRVADVIAAVARHAGRPELVRFGARPQLPDESGRLTADVRRLRDEVDFLASIDLQQGIARTVDWWRANISAEDALGLIPAAAPHTGAPASRPPPAWVRHRT